MGYLLDWLHEHHLAPATFNPDTKALVEVLKNSWITVMLLLLGMLAIITAILVAWPALAYLASKLFV